MNFIDYLFENTRHSINPLIQSDTFSISYADVWNRAIEISGWIQEHIGSSHKIGILADNSPFFIQSYAGIIHSGNTVVVIDTKSSPEEILQILSQCSIRILFLDSKYQSLASGIFCVTSESSFSGNKHSVPSSTIPADDCAVIIFTSGSTGQKKGVMLTHANLIANTRSIIQYLNITYKDRMMVVLPFFYCYGASLMHTHIRMGGSLVLSDTPFLGGALKAINRFHCTGFAGVPSTYLILIHKTPFLQMTFPSLRYFTQAGGHLPSSVIFQIASTFPDKEFFVMYGATEATARLSFLPPDVLFEKPDSIGKGIPGVFLKVLNEEGHNAMPGETGEIVAAGDNIMAGYFDDPDETAKVIKEGWYHTGDLATVDEDGFIYIVGRKGSFIKSAGFRVSPLEIEDIILQFDGVDACIVFGMPDSIFGEAIIACIQSSRDEDVIIPPLQKYCKTHLPSHKQPTAFHVLGDLPLNSSGKPDRDTIKKMFTQV